MRGSGLGIEHAGTQGCAGPKRDGDMRMTGIETAVAFPPHGHSPDRTASGRLDVMRPRCRAEARVAGMRQGRRRDICWRLGAAAGRAGVDVQRLGRREEVRRGDANGRDRRCAPGWVGVASRSRQHLRLRLAGRVPACATVQRV